MLRIAGTLGGSAKRCVRTALVVVPSPSAILTLASSNDRNQWDVHAFISQAAVKRRHKRVVRKPARPAEVERDAVLAGPAVERFREELGAIAHWEASERELPRP